METQKKKLNLWRECPFWNDDGLCMNRDCSVETTDEVKKKKKENYFIIVCYYGNIFWDSGSLIF